MLKFITISLLFIFTCGHTYSQVKLNTLNINSTADLKEFFSYTSDRIPLVCAHRGGDRVGFPENAIATFENTLSRMHAFFEIDPRLTKDGVIVTFHDETLERTTNGTGKLADYTWEELKQLKLKDTEGNITPYRINTLEEVLLWAKGKTILILDKKDVPLNKLLALIEANQAESYVLISAFSINDAIYYYSRNPKIMFEAVIETEAEMNAYESSIIPWENIVAFTRRTDVVDDGVPANVNTLLNQKFREKGVMCMLSTMKYQDKEKNRDTRVAGYRNLVANHGIDIILSDRASELSEALKNLIPGTSSKSKFFQQGIFDSDYSQAVTDIDGNIYNTVTIGNQVWASSNLKVTRYRNGDPIPTGLNNSAWSSTVLGAYSVYPFTDAGENNEAAVKEKYGLLYNAYAINDSRNIAPIGWRVATDDDWKELETYNGMATSVLDLSDWRNTNGEGQQLKSEEGWTWDSKAGTDKYGFNALPGGYRAASGTYGQIKNRAYFWTGSTSTKTTPSNWRRILEYNKISIHRVDISRNEGYAVRLIKENNTAPVNLINFRLKKGTNYTVISWETVSEQNNDYFVVERSSNGKNFKELTKISGKGTTTEKQDYTFTDYFPLGGVNYYRLIQTDKDGTENNYGIRSVSFNLNNTVMFLAYPNPVQDSEITIKLAGYKGKAITLSLVNIMGLTIYKENILVAPEKTDYVLNLTKKPVAGQYILNVQGDGLNKSLKLMVAK
ncbi:FISUMP domain-containing protein [Pseudopedobacter beijingensis]|uniref:FISUMP domain-containing protein n=1 Tax=Pseudopedobacter beijingensis TaxID=1207056 RepID=A0ABW4IE42_9SPHI